MHTRGAVHTRGADRLKVHVLSDQEVQSYPGSWTQGGGAVFVLPCLQKVARRTKLNNADDSDSNPSGTRPTPRAVARRLKKKKHLKKTNTGETYLGRSFLGGLLASFASFPTTHPPIGRATSVTWAAGGAGTLDP